MLVGNLGIWPIIVEIEGEECRRGRIEKINDHRDNLKGVENLELLD